MLDVEQLIPDNYGITECHIQRIKQKWPDGKIRTTWALRMGPHDERMLVGAATLSACFRVWHEKYPSWLKRLRNRKDQCKTP